MNKKIFSVALAAFVSAAVANADDNLTFNWAHSVDDGTTVSEYPIAIEKAADEGYYAAVGFQTTNTSLSVKVDGAELTDASGNAMASSVSGSSSNNRDLLLMKTDPETGSVKWFAYTSKGYVYYNDTHIKATSDGGVVAAVKTRVFVQETGMDNLLEVVDATGATTTIKDLWVQSGEYRYIILKLDKDGKFAWARLVSGLVKEVTVSDKTNKTTDSFVIKGMEVDDNDNIYLCGNFRTEVSFKKSDGTLATLTAKTVDGWNGSDQNVGELFIAALDADGYYKNSFHAGENAYMAYFDKMVYDSGKLYLNGRLLSNGTAINIGGKPVTASESFQTELIASVNTDSLTVNYATTLTSLGNAATKPAFLVQNKNAQFVDGYVYFTGGINGGWQKEGSESALLNTNDKYLKGYVLKVDPATGDAVSAMLSQSTGISAYFGVYPGEYNLYAFGYDMKVAKGVLTQFANADSGYAGELQVCSLSGNAGIPAFNDDEIVMMNSGKGTATFYGTDTQLSGFTNWGLVYYSYKVTDTVTGIGSIEANSQGEYSVYTVNGVRVRNASTREEAVSGLPKGVYIVGGEKIVVK